MRGERSPKSEEEERREARDGVTNANTPSETPATVLTLVVDLQCLSAQNPP